MCAARPSFSSSADDARSDISRRKSANAILRQCVLTLWLIGLCHGEAAVYSLAVVALAFILCLSLRR
ncbi:hypothetical protein BCCGELA001_30745 [Bradyrhizobium sp. CCGE-LA001]|nr:hypothetical protein BCCGELA001_30745 [Bradyrhizobium sp. CCGE-LA001]